MVSAQMLVQQLRLAFEVIANLLAPTSYLFVPPAVVQNYDCYDYIVVGGGTAGCIIASRLAEDGKAKVMLVEAGGDPPLESLFSGFFALLPGTIHDWKYESVPQPGVAQYTVNKSLELIAGKMLGGSSSLNHVINVRSHPSDYNAWADIINNSAWNYENLLPYLKKPENLVVDEVLESEYGQYYGTDGPVTITKASDEIAKELLTAFKEIGPDESAIRKSLGVLGYNEPLNYISNVDGYRQTTALTYLSILANKPNLDVLKNTEATRILFDENKNAVGVLARNKSGEFQLNAKKEVIVCAGALNTPKLLMLSGVGPKEKLENLGINVVSDLPVGENLQDQVSVPIGFRLGASNEPQEPRDPHKYPTPAVFGLNTLNSTDDIPDFATTVLIFGQNATQIPLLFTGLYNYDEKIGNTFYNASIGHKVTIVSITLLHPKSRGTVELRSNNYTDDPLINLNSMSDEEDVTNLAKYLQKNMLLLKTEYFKSVDAEFIEMDVGCGKMDNSLRFWICYVRAIWNSCWQYAGTCAASEVSDANSKVMGVEKLRLGDASIFPTLTSGFLGRSVMGIAEKVADLIKTTSC